MRFVGALLILGASLAGCAGGSLPGTPAPLPPSGLLLPEDPLAASRDAFMAHPGGIRLLVVVSPT